MGTGTLINVNNGLDATYKADALDGWSDVVNYTSSGVVTPNLSEASPPISLVVRSGDVDPVTGASTLITAYRSDFVDGVRATAGARAVASVFMHNAVLNEYVLDAATASATDWVITQPVKNQFVRTAGTETPYTAAASTAGSCEFISFTFFDREERFATAAGGDFSPRPAPTGSLCWESTVLSIRNVAGSVAASEVLGSRNMTNVSVSTFQNGWARLSFTGTNATTTGLPTFDGTRVSLGTDATGFAGTVTPGPVTFLGLPVTGFMVRTFQNGGVTCAAGTCQGNYGGLFQHSYQTTITP
jgi:hypothetical protein